MCSVIVTGENKMRALLSGMSDIAVLFIILCAAGQMLQRRIAYPLTVTLLLAPAALLFFLGVPGHPGEGASWGFPYVYLIFFLPVYGLFLGTLSKKLFVFLCQLFAGCVIGGLSHLLAQAFFPEFGDGYAVLRLVLTVLVGIPYLVWMGLDGRKVGRELLTGEEHWIWAVYAAGPCLGCWILSIALGPGTVLVVPMLILFAVWSLSVLILAILSQRAREQAMLDLSLARSVINAAAGQSEELHRVIEEVRILKHDCKHHLHAAQMMLETGHTEEAKKYLLAFGTKCDTSTFPLFCKNPPVNALLVGYWRRCADAGIDFSAFIELGEDPLMDSFELCTLMGNLLENALDACKKAPEGQRRIVLNGAPHGGKLLITVKNSFDGAVLQDKGQIVSRKGALGGLGIKSIRQIAARHQGEYVPTWEGQTFTARVVLRL